MKKSSFLHNPKDMLSKSFKPAKCKTSLKLASSRIKLMKNKKEVQVKQMKRELAQLLDSGQDQTARIRVEHVIREEKMMSAYELIEIYCELIVARLPIIEAQKNCPIDLKEAITSVLFASPRCGDIPELSDVKKHFTAKYGKEFTSAAIDLRPNCGVSRMLVEKLSINAPDGPAKIKILTAIAEEHNIKWDSKGFGDSETVPNDLLNGPSSFENANKMHAEAYSVPDVQDPRSHQGMHNQPVSSSDQNMRSSLASQNLPSQVSGASNVVSSISRPERRSSGASRQEFKQEFHGDSDGQQSWNMKFKDATAAAQAAAESAEHASMAARAAAKFASHGRVSRKHSTKSHKSDVNVHRDANLHPRSPNKQNTESERSYQDDDRGSNISSTRATAELSSRGRVSRQHSAELHKSDVHFRRDEGTTKHSASEVTNNYRPKDSAYLDPGVPSKQNTESEKSYQDDHGSDVRSAQKISSRSKGSFEKDLFVRNHGADEYSQKGLSKEKEMEAEMEIHSDESEAEYESHLPERFSPEKYDYYGEERTKIQSSINSSGPHSSVSAIDGKDLKSGNRVFRHDLHDDHSDGFDGDMYRDSLQSGSHDAGHVTFDESSSDGEDFGFGTGSHHEEFYVPSPDRNLTTHLPADPGTGSLFRLSNSQERSQSEFSTKRNSFHEFSGSMEETMDTSQPNDNFAPVTFDDSDGQSSEDEADMGHTLSKENPSRGSPKSSFAESHPKNDQRTETTVGSPQKFGFGEERASHSSPTWGKSQLESGDRDSDTPYYNPVDQVNKHDSSQSRLSLAQEVNENSGYSNELNFGKLTGGLRHKGYTQPPYIRSQLENVSSSSRERDEEKSPTVIPQSAASPPEESSRTGNSKVSGNSMGSRVPNSHYDSGSDSFEASQKKPLSRGQEQYIGRADKGVESSTGNSKVSGNTMGSRVPNSHYDSDSDSFEESQKQPLSRGRESYIGRADKDVKAKSNVRGPVTYFESESSDSENDSKKQVFTGRSRLGAGVSSRRTKVSPPSSDSTTHTKDHASSVVRKTSVSVPERNPTRTSYSESADSVPERNPTRTSYSASADSVPERNPTRTTYSASADSVPERNREDVGKYASQVPRKKNQEASDSAKPQKTASGSSITREDSGKKASHVHPNLPDYDTLAARMQALRSNHQ